MEDRSSTAVVKESDRTSAAPARVKDPSLADEDELDDLDDILDEFSATKLDNQDGPSMPNGPGRPEEDEDFAKQLQAGMKDLLGGLADTPEMQQQLESLVKELSDVATDGAVGETAESSKLLESLIMKDRGDAGTGGTTVKAEAANPTASFQDTIQRTMQRMQASGEQATAAAVTAEDTNDDILAQMLRQMQDGGSSGGGEAGAASGDTEEEFSKMLLGMMEQLTNKEILYEPMRELHDKFPAWMEKSRDTVSKDDLRRYEEQQVLVAEIVARFEEKGYSDSNAAHREYIVERMQKMQAAGAPPPDLVGDMSAAQEAMSDMDAGCAQQ